MTITRKLTTLKRPRVDADTVHLDQLRDKPVKITTPHVPSWEDCLEAGLTAREAAEIRGTHPSAAGHYAKSHGFTWAKPTKRVEPKAKGRAFTKRAKPAPQPAAEPSPLRVSLDLGTLDLGIPVVLAWMLFAMWATTYIIGPDASTVMDRALVVLMAWAAATAVWAILMLVRSFTD